MWEPKIFDGKCRAKQYLSVDPSVNQALGHFIQVPFQLYRSCRTPASWYVCLWPSVTVQWLSVGLFILRVSPKLLEKCRFGPSYGTGSLGVFLGDFMRVNGDNNIHRCLGRVSMGFDDGVRTVRSEKRRGGLQFVHSKWYK